MSTLSFETFKRFSRKYTMIPVCRDIVVDQITPVSVYERLSQEEPYAFLLESVEGGEHVGRYSFVGRRPQAVFTAKDNRVIYQKGGKEECWTTTNPVHDLKSILKTIQAPELVELSRFWGGAVGYWDYDTVRCFERIPNHRPDLLQLPQGAFQFSGDIVVLDRFSQTAKVISNVSVPKGTRSPKVLAALYRKALKSIDLQIAAIQRAERIPRHHGRPQKVVAVPLVKRADYLTAVKKAKDYIRAGDIIQVVLSQRWALRPRATPFQIYRALRLVNPSPYMYYLHFPGFDVVGSSPELLVRKEGILAETRPIAGTRRRGTSPEEDKTLAEELKKDPKERAEHLMLVDLGRNDLGRVCEPGSVRVSDFMTIENYSHVMHLVSSVTGRLNPSSDAFDLFQACFPAGTVSGAPKIRAMEIIDELESFRRGLYAGALGYFSYTGNMDLAITIRTLVFTAGRAYLQAGAGIVADSIPEKEYRECEQKAAALLAAIAKAGELI